MYTSLIVKPVEILRNQTLEFCLQIRTNQNLSCFKPCFVKSVHDDPFLMIPFFHQHPVVIGRERLLLVAEYVTEKKGLENVVRDGKKDSLLGDKCHHYWT
jgi:hypothetical protein